MRPELDVMSYRSVPVLASQGPEPPNPLVMERFQQVISQLFQQVRPRGWQTCVGVWEGKGECRRRAMPGHGRVPGG